MSLITDTYIHGRANQNHAKNLEADLANLKSIPLFVPHPFRYLYPTLSAICTHPFRFCRVYNATFYSRA